MFRTVEGITIPFPDKIQEGICIVKEKEDYTSITANVSAEKIDETFQKLAEKVKTPGFLILEIPTQKIIEDNLLESEIDTFHRDVYYLDGLNHDEFFQIYSGYKELLISDGLVNFGFGSHDVVDEVLVGKYKIFSILSTEPEKYIDIFKELRFRIYDKLITAWDTFSEEYPGTVKKIVANGIEIYDLPDLLKGRGLYFAKHKDE